MTDVKLYSQSANMLSFQVLRLLVPYQNSPLDLLGGLQHSTDPLLISSCLRRDKRQLDLEHKNSGMTKYLEKPPVIGSKTFTGTTLDSK